MSPPSEARHYKVLDVLGRGGFGTVYRAELHGSGGFRKLVALKVLREEVQAQTAALARLRDEARLLGRLHHRAIVQVDGLVQLDGRWAVVMEFVDGVSLADALKRHGPVPVTVALQIVEEVASALHVAYELSREDDQPLRLLHRDVKPSNIQVGPTGAVKLLDFGVARAELEGREAHTGGMVYGSMPYLAPERLELVDTHKGDIYALGVTLLELVDERLPVAAIPAPAEHEGRVSAAAERVAALGGPELAALVRSVLAFDMAERPDARALERTCRELRRQLEGPELADWAPDVIALLVDTRELATDELSGSTLGEQAEQAVSSTLSGLLGAATTWDESEGVSAARVTKIAPARRRPWWLIGGVLVSGVTGLALAAVLVGVVGLFGLAFLVGVPLVDFVNHGSCAQAFTEMRVALNEVAPSPSRAAVDRLVQRGRRACDSGDLGVVGATSFDLEFRSYVADGQLTDREARMLESTLDDLLP